MREKWAKKAPDMDQCERIRYIPACQYSYLIRGVNSISNAIYRCPCVLWSTCSLILCRSNWTRALLMSALFDVQVQPRADTTHESRTNPDQWQHVLDGGEYFNHCGKFSYFLIEPFLFYKNVVNIITIGNVRFSILFARKMEIKDESFRLSEWKEFIEWKYLTNSSYKIT